MIAAKTRNDNKMPISPACLAPVGFISPSRKLILMPAALLKAFTIIKTIHIIRYDVLNTATSSSPMSAAIAPTTATRQKSDADPSAAGRYYKKRGELRVY